MLFVCISTMTNQLQHKSRGLALAAAIDARAVVHHVEISVKYAQHRYFVACNSAANKIELSALVGAHLGLKPGKNLTQAVFHYFTTGPCSLLVLNNLETVWEPIECRGDIEEFLSLLTDVLQLALVVGVSSEKGG
jgi:hypothetical protein